MDRLEELQNIFNDIDEDKRATIAPLLQEVVFIENRLEELRKLPHIRVHIKNPAMQEVTAAGKQYKEMLQQYTNAIKLLLMTLYRNGGGGADELLQKLQEFEI